MKQLSDFNFVSKEMSVISKFKNLLLQDDFQRSSLLMHFQDFILLCVKIYHKIIEIILQLVKFQIKYTSSNLFCFFMYILIL